MKKNKANYKGKHADLTCRLCDSPNSEETLVHLSVCPFVCSHVPGITDISVNDIYGDIEVQCKAVAVWQKVFDFIQKVKMARRTENMLPVHLLFVDMD